MTIYYRDAAGRYLGGFDGKTGGLPVGAIEVPDAPERADFVWADGVGWQPDAAALAAIKAEATAIVDDSAEAARRRWITSAAGQTLVYEAKRREAEAWAASASPRALGDYAFMRGRAARLNGVLEADATEAQMQAVATDWLAKIVLWRDAGIAIEAAREQAKEDIDAVVDAAAVQVVLDGLAWPAPA